MNRFATHLEPAAHALLIGIAIAVSWTYWQSGDTPPRSRDAPTIKFDSSKALSVWNSSEERVFLFISPSCPFTTLSMDFYARLSRVVDSMQQAGAPVALAAVIDRSDSRQVQLEMLRSSNVAVDTLLTLSVPDLTPVGVTEVPTVAVESPDDDPSTWVGLQDPTGEEEILSVVRELDYPK